MRAGELVQLTPLVGRVTANNPGPMTANGTNTYLVGRDVLAVVDPGPADPAHVEAILRAANGRPIRWLLATHTHPDHSPAAALLARETGASMIGCTLADDGHQDRSFVVDSNLLHGDLLHGEGFTLEAVATPGHVANHFCYFLREESLLFTGDHIMAGSTVVIIPPSGDMADYLHSLELLKHYPISRLLPGHGEVLDDPIGVVEGLIAHRLRREDKILRVMRGGSGEYSLQALTPLVYDDVDASLHLVAQVSLWAHLLKLEKEGRATKRAERHWLFGQECWRLFDEADQRLG